MAQQRTLLTIGAGPGNGLATAERFAREGWRVVLAARNEDKLRRHVEQLKAKGVQASAQRVDAGDAADVAALIKCVHADHGGIDALHYNAASMREASILDQPRDSFASDLTVNIGGALVAIQAVAPLMPITSGRFRISLATMVVGGAVLCVTRSIPMNEAVRRCSQSSARRLFSTATS